VNDLRRGRGMKSYLRLVEQLSKFMNVIAGIALTFMMLLTVVDVILRRMGKAIPGTYELVAFSGVVVVGFALAYTSFVRAHVFVDLVVEKLGLHSRRVVLIFTKLVGGAFFVMLGINLIKDGFNLIQTGELSPTLQFPFYPMAFGLGLCSFVVCLVLLSDIPKIIGGDYE
jgi:TRAP-type C4-dicarboxylate transport system permease small subunit